MALDKLIQSIESEAQREAERILQEAKAQAEHIRQDARKQAQAEAEKRRAARVQQCRQESDQAIAQATLEARNRLLDTRQEWIDKVFAAALQALQGLEPERSRQWLENKLLQVCTRGDEQVLLPEPAKAMVSKDWLQQLNRKLKDKGLAGKLTVKFEKTPFTGGFILKSQQFDVVVTFEELLRQLREQAQAEIHDALFREDDA